MLGVGVPGVGVPGVGTPAGAALGRRTGAGVVAGAGRRQPSSTGRAAASATRRAVRPWRPAGVLRQVIVGAWEDRLGGATRGVVRLPCPDSTARARGAVRHRWAICKRFAHPGRWTTAASRTRTRARLHRRPMARRGDARAVHGCRHAHTRRRASRTHPPHTLGVVGRRWTHRTMRSPAAAAPRWRHTRCDAASCTHCPSARPARSPSHRPTRGRERHPAARGALRAQPPRGVSALPHPGDALPSSASAMRARCGGGAPRWVGARATRPRLPPARDAGDRRRAPASVARPVTRRRARAP
jgi:hypothetical protein